MRCFGGLKTFVTFLDNLQLAVSYKRPKVSTLYLHVRKIFGQLEDIRVSDRRSQYMYLKLSKKPQFLRLP